MSSSEDSGTEEWEREQMLRGTHSRGRQQAQQQLSGRQQSKVASNQPNLDQISNIIDPCKAKSHIMSDIDDVETDIEIVKKNIGSTRLDIVRSEKRIVAIKRQIEELKVADLFFEKLSQLKEPEEVLGLLDGSRAILARLPHDQKEMLDLLESSVRDIRSPMDVDD